jgi:hypothetical protein
MIELAVQTYGFYRRTALMLSSLLDANFQNYGTVKLNVWEDDPYLPSYYDIFDYFENRLNMNVRPWTGKGFTNRGVVRNSDVMETTADWLYFADTDIVFPPTFFAELSRLNLNTKAFYTIARYTMNEEDGNALAAQVSAINPYVSNTYDKAMGVNIGISGGKRRSVCGAGYTQMAHVASLDGYYCHEPRDYRKDGRAKYSSDRLFRTRFDQRLVLPLERPVHIQHGRDYSKLTDSL